MADLKVSQLTQVTVPAGSTEWHVNEAASDKALNMTQMATYTLDGSHDSNFNWNGSLLAITGNITATNVNGIALTTGGSATDYLDGTGSYSAPPTLNHASNHTDGTDDIQDANASQKGLLTNTAQTIGGDKTFTEPVTQDDFTTDNEILTVDSNGTFQASGVLVESSPTGGSGFTVTNYASDPTSPPTGFLWIQDVDANTKKLSFFDGADTYSVDLGKE